MADRPTSLVEILKATWSNFSKDECMRLAAALAYYTVFALPPLLALLVLAAGLIWDPAEIVRALHTQFSGFVGEESAKTIQGMITRAEQPIRQSSVLASIGGLAALAFGATGAFVELQSALNRAWQVKPDPKQGGVKNFIMKRLLSLGMVLGIAFLLAVSLAFTAAVAAFGGILAGRVAESLLQVLDIVLNLTVLALLFAAMFKVLPDAKIAWRDVWVGAGVTALLFVIGKFLIGYYLGRSSTGSVFGAARSFAIILLWIYYAGVILLLGAEFTQVWAESKGKGIAPEGGAVRIERKEIRKPAGQSTR
jgi:membrane protein